MITQNLIEGFDQLKMLSPFGLGQEGAVRNVRSVDRVLPPISAGGGPLPEMYNKAGQMDIFLRRDQGYDH